MMTASAHHFYIIQECNSSLNAQERVDVDPMKRMVVGQVIHLKVISYSSENPGDL